ncbi:MAG: HNH endonuclease [Planctomycetota bacterium]|nr:HNH endonuclease [Planctomycetota bacterium]
MPTTKNCVYCGSNANSTGEHIVPDAIAGALTIEQQSGLVVCATCNNRTLSVLDTELCKHSYLGLVAAQELSTAYYQAWDVDQSDGNLLIEGEANWSRNQLKTFIVYPQIIFDEHGPEFRGDDEQAKAFGLQNFSEILVTAVKRALREHQGGQKRKLHFRRVSSEILNRGYRFPPRIFTNRTISQIAEKEVGSKKPSFTIRYISQNDKDTILRQLETLEVPKPDEMGNYKCETQLGLHFPLVNARFDLSLSMRAMVKLGVNLLAAFCDRTPVNCTTFGFATGFVLGDITCSLRILQFNGFVHAESLKCIASGDQSHSFRLVHEGDLWRIYSSFFGGRICTAVTIPGPNLEEWSTMDIIAPLGSKQWRLTTSTETKLLPFRVEWGNLKQIAPSVDLHNSDTKLTIE